jgi:hypothetical protein
LGEAQDRIRTLERTLADWRRERDEACLRQELALIFHGASLRGAAECLEVGFGDQAPSKSTIAEHLKEACAAARELFEEYFEGFGRAAACDEVYLSGHPCLEVVEPRSLAITGILPDTEPTERAWTDLLNTFPGLECGVSDQGLGVSKALAKAVARFGLDTWHLLRPFSEETGRLEARAYERIGEEDRRREAFVEALASFAPGRSVPPEMDRLQEAVEKAEKCIRRYDDASLILGWLYEATEPVDAQGRIKAPERMRGDWEAALDLIDHVDAEGLYSIEKKLRGKIDGAPVRGLAERIGALPMPKGWAEASREAMQGLTCRSWLHHHRRETHILEAPKEAAVWVAGEMGSPFAAEHWVAYCASAFELLDLAPRASSAVECVNSVIRLRQGSKRHPSPDFVYLLAWLHNTRAFDEGRRKGLTPAEILGVRLTANGLAMLVERMAARKASANPGIAA